jgi:DNA repair exonuclease SbcCD nuclease subunit
MKILFIGDPHIRINNFEQSVKFLHWVDEVVEQHNPDVVCNLGDTFHDHAVLRSELMTEFANHVKRIVAKGKPYWYVLGNHDQYKPKDSKYHALQVFDIPGLKVFDKITNVSEDITVVPYVQEFRDFPLSTNRICITHNTFIGADYGFKREDAGVDAGKVNADIIVSGHIHKRQSFGNVVYPGTPFAHDANDVGQSKGLLLLDIETYKQTFIESPFPRYRGLEFEVSQENTMTNIHQALEQELDSVDHWIIKVKGPKTELSAYFKSKKYLDLIKGKKVISKSVPTDSEKQNRVKIKSTSPQEIVSEYINKVYDGSLDKSLIIQKAQQIIENLQ